MVQIMPEGNSGRAVVLLSGGLDSSVVLAIAMDEGYNVRALTIDYGQRHFKEVEAARALAKHFDVEHKVVRVDLSAFGGSTLTDRKRPLPMDRSADRIGSDIPATYVPARNTVFISVAMAWAESIGAEAIFIGANAIDYSGYPDCRPDYLEAMGRVAELGTRCGVKGEPMRLVAPIIDMDKGAIVRRGVELGVPFDLTWSCYRGTPKACGRCDSCQLRLRGFASAGEVDPLPYETVAERPDLEARGGLGNPGNRTVVAELVEEGALEEETRLGLDDAVGGGG
jgi:7-cyano-7-deazaguanine synthase